MTTREDIDRMIAAAKSETDSIDRARMARAIRIAADETCDDEIIADAARALKSVSL